MALLPAVWIAGAVSSRAMAADVGAMLGYRGEYSDNIRLVPTDPEKEWINSALAGLAYRARSADYAADLAGVVEYRDYARQTYPDETLFYLSTAGVWTIAPQRFLWTLIDRFDQLPQDATRAPTPDNREAVNVVDTGPDFLINLNPVNVLVLGMRVGNTWFKEAATDSNRVLASLRWRYQWNPVTLLSANAEEQRIRYTTAEAAPVVGVGDYHREDYYLRYDRRAPSGRVMLDAGASNIVPDGPVNDVSEPIFRVNAAYRLTHDSAVGILGSHELMSLSTALLSGVADPTAPESITAPSAIPLDLASGDIYVNRMAEVFYTRSGDLLGAQLSAFGRDLDYLTTPQDRTEAGGALRVSYRLSTTFTTTAYGNAVRSELQALDRLDRDVGYGVALAYQATPNVTVSLEGRHNQRNSSDAVASYEETRALIQLLYNTNPRFPVPTGR